MESISFSHFKMTYESGFALRDISLSVNSGDFVVLTGGTGSGKSTLLRQLVRPFVSRDYEGSLTVNGIEMREMTERQSLDVGYVMQCPREQIVTDKVYHELSFGLENMALSRDEIRLRVSETAGYFGISEYMDRSTFSLSGGEMQTVNLASVMAMRPRILLLDEPTSQLDEVAAEKFISLVYRINRELGTTVIIAEHRLDMLEHYDKMVIMEGGAVRYAGTSPKGYDELPIYTRVGEILGEDIRTISRCRDVLASKDIDNNYILDKVQPPRHMVKVMSVSNVWHRYARDDRDILRGVDLDVYKGEILALVGGNGAGKSTLLSMMSGAIPCYKGHIKTYGNSVTYIMQNITFLEDSVQQEIESTISLHVKAYRMKTKKAKDANINVDGYRAELANIRDRYLDIFDLKKVLNTPPNQISGGEKAKLAILIALLAQPDVLLLDEPTKGLDAQSKATIRDVLERVSHDGTTIVIVSHDIEMIGQIATRVATLFDGTIVSICTPRMLLSTNYLFTTTTRRICRGIVDDVLLENELLELVHSRDN